VSLWLAVARAPDTDETVCADLRAALAVAAAVDERLVRAGIAGVEGAIDAQRRIESVLAGVDAERLAALRRTVAALERELRGAVEVLARLRFLKQIFDAPGRTPS
jgi:hypothetical protein